MEGKPRSENAGQERKGSKEGDIYKIPALSLIPGGPWDINSALEVLFLFCLKVWELGCMFTPYASAG